MRLCPSEQVQANEHSSWTPVEALVADPTDPDGVTSPLCQSPDQPADSGNAAPSSGPPAASNGSDARAPTALPVTETPPAAAAESHSAAASIHGPLATQPYLQDPATCQPLEAIVEQAHLAGQQLQEFAQHLRRFQKDEISNPKAPQPVSERLEPPRGLAQNSMSYPIRAGSAPVEGTPDLFSRRSSPHLNMFESPPAPAPAIESAEPSWESLQNTLQKTLLEKAKAELETAANGATASSLSGPLPGQPREEVDQPRGPESAKADEQRSALEPDGTSPEAPCGQEPEEPPQPEESSAPQEPHSPDAGAISADVSQTPDNDEPAAAPSPEHPDPSDALPPSSVQKAAAMPTTTESMPLTTTPPGLHNPALQPSPTSPPSHTVGTAAASTVLEIVHLADGLHYNEECVIDLASVKCIVSSGT